MDPSYWFFWTWCLPLMLAVAVAEEQGEACLAKTCGNLTVSDPFWLADIETGRLCGSLDFEVTCSNNSTAFLRSSHSLGHSYNFEIVDILYEERSLRVVDNRKLELLNTFHPCKVPTWNTSVEFGRSFRIDPGNLNLVLYNCSTAASAALARQDPALVEMGCGRKSNTTFVRVGGCYNGSENYEGYYLDGCISNSLPVLGTSGEANASDYEQLIGDGFLLTWDLLPPGNGKLTP